MNKISELKENQRKYIVLIGGMMELRETDQTYNDYNREIILAYKEEYPNAKIGYIYEPLFDEDENGEIFREIVEDKVKNFCCNFVLPEPDKEVETLIRKIRETGYDYKDMIRINDKIDEMEGTRFYWV